MGWLCCGVPALDVDVGCRFRFLGEKSVTVIEPLLPMDIVTVQLFVDQILQLFEPGDFRAVECRFQRQYQDVVVCAYDLNQFRASVVMDVMRTHPMILIGGTLQENPFFVPPEEFLRELRGRTTHAV